MPFRAVTDVLVQSHPEISPALLGKRRKNLSVKNNNNNDMFTNEGCILELRGGDPRAYRPLSIRSRGKGETWRRDMPEQRRASAGAELNARLLAVRNPE